MDAREFRENGHAVIDLIAEYLETIGDRPVSPDVRPGDVRARLPEHPPTSPESFDALLNDVREIIIPASPIGNIRTSSRSSPAIRRTRRYSPTCSPPDSACRA
jgi:hypothetical protein